MRPLKRTEKMPLHREIFWVGKQWAVTGFGLQACDQKQKGKFDIDISRLWDDDLLESMHAQEWLNIGDFDKALAVAREHYPQPRRKAAAALVVALPEPDSELKQDSPKPAPVSANFAIHAADCRARFLRPWRVRVRWQRDAERSSAGE